MSQVALIVGVGPGLGAAIARRFAHEDFRVAVVARRPKFINELARERFAGSELIIATVADATEPRELANAIGKVRAELGPINVLVYNASSSSGDGLLETNAEQFEQSWRIAALGAFVCARETAPDMIAAGAGAMIFTGATSSVRGGGWLAFSSAKFALRGLAQCLARELWPQGIHVAHVIIDGIIRSSGDTESSEPMIDPDKIAEAYFQLAEQDRSAWTLELDLRPHREKFFE